MGISHSKNDEDESSSSSNMTQYDYDRDDSSHHHKHSSDSSSSTTTTCVLDEHVLNRHTIHNMTNLGLSIFADLCGRNRGVFVVPGDGNAETYSCLTFPPSFADGLDEGIPMATSNDVDQQLAAGNITGSQAMHILQQVTEAVYAASGSAANEFDPYACNLGGLSKLAHCPFETQVYPGDAPKATIWRSDGNVLRGVTLAGLFVPAPWATGGQALTVKEAQAWYTPNDFADMRNMGINTVVIPIPTTNAFWLDNHHHNRHDNTSPSMQLLRSILGMVSNAKLQAILQLESDPAASSSLDDLHQAVERATSLVRDHYVDTVSALQLPATTATGTGSSHAHVHPSDSLSQLHTLVQVARKVSKHVRLLVPINAGQLPHVNYWYNDPHVYASMSTDHTSAIADIASSSSLDDRMKLFYHESVACMQRSPLDYSHCYKNLPVFVSSGFDLAIDNCAEQHASTSFVDYGQCSRFDETVHSDWWHRHRTSFAERQLTANEHGLGWTFAAYKVWEDDHNGNMSHDHGHKNRRVLAESFPWLKGSRSSSSSGSSMDGGGVIATPSQLYSFKAVTAAGLFPDLNTYVSSSSSKKANKHGTDAADMPKTTLPVCLNPPLSDFILGDETLSPTPGPPPDCGNGWWNVTIQDCSYWVPPPPPPPCPVCEVCFFPNPSESSEGDEVNGTASAAMTETTTTAPSTNMTEAATVPPMMANATESVPKVHHKSVGSSSNSSSPNLFLESSLLSGATTTTNQGYSSYTTSHTALSTAFLAGAVTAVVVGVVGHRVFGRIDSRRYRNGAQYTSIPN